MAAKLETQASFAEEIDFDDLKFEKVVGKGSFGVVSKAQWRGTTGPVAVKMIETEEEIKAFKVEVTQLSRVDHPNIVKLFGACTAGPVCLVMEYAEGGSLYNVLHGTPQPIYTAAHAMSWALQSAKGVAYLHAMRPKALIHRDLKPANLLLMAGGTELKICDFGTACDIQTYMTNNKGSAAWMAPEVFEGRQYSEKCDVFSWGIILWEVISRRKPFDEIGGPAFRIMWAVHQGTRPPKIRGIPKPLDALMNRCWSEDHGQRPSMEEVVRIMQPLLQYFKGKEEEPLVYPRVEEQVEEPHVSMNLLDLEGATQDTNLTENSEYHGSRASTISDTIIRAEENTPVKKRETGGNLKTRDPEYEKRRRSADLLQYHGNREEEEADQEPKAVVRKGHQRSNSHGHIIQSSIPPPPVATTKSTAPSSPTITISVVSPSPPTNQADLTEFDPVKQRSSLSHSNTAPNLTEFDPLKQRSNSDESHRILTVTDPSGADRPRSGSQGNMVPPLLPQKANMLSDSPMLSKPPDKPMRSVSLDHKMSQSKVDDDIVIPMAYMTLDHHLQPLPPHPKSRASVEIFDKHCEAAQEYMRVQTELALLHQRKNELASELDEDWKDQQASFKMIEEFRNLRAEKESLLHVHRNLRAQLDLIRAQVQRRYSMNRKF